MARIGGEGASPMTEIESGTVVERLEQLAAWHRANAEHAGSAWVWEARLRTAEDLERRAAGIRARRSSQSAGAPSGLKRQGVAGREHGAILVRCAPPRPRGDASLCRMRYCRPLPLPPR